MGLPIVATNIRGCRQVVQDGINGLLVPVRDSKALGAAIQKLVDDLEVRKTMGRAGYDKSRRDFDERHICRTVVDTYERLLQRKAVTAEAPKPAG